MQEKTFRITKIILSLFTVLIVLSLIALTIWTSRLSIKRDIGQIIAQDVAQLADIFAKIDATAGILGFDNQKNEINFLNIKKDGFVGSELGSMNLKNPKNWQGPYLEEMPRMQEHDYMIVRTKKGYFITPGQGVKLPNGKIIGKDIILDEDADIELMMHDNQMLLYQGQSLAAKITVSGQSSSVSNIVMPEDEG